MGASTTAASLVAALDKEFEKSSDAIKRLHHLALGAVGPSWSSEYSALQSQISDHLANCRAHLFDLEVLADDVGGGNVSNDVDAAAQAAAGRQTLQRLMSELKAGQAAAARAASRRYAENRAQLLAGATPAKDVRSATSAASIVSSSESITAGLKRIRAMMSQELDVSGASLSLLDASTQKIASAATEYDDQHGKLKQSSQLLRVIKWQDLKETVLTYAGIAFFTAVCVYILVKRSAMFVPALPAWLAPASSAGARNSSSRAAPVVPSPGLPTTAGGAVEAPPSDAVHGFARDSGFVTKFTGSDDISDGPVEVHEYSDFDTLQPGTVSGAADPLQDASSASNTRPSGSLRPTLGSDLDVSTQGPDVGMENVFLATPADVAMSADGAIDQTAPDEGEAVSAVGTLTEAPGYSTSCAAEASAACEQQPAAANAAAVVDGVLERMDDQPSPVRARTSGLQMQMTQERMVNSLPPAPRSKKKWQSEVLDPQKQRVQQDIVHSRTKHIHRGAPQPQRQPTRSVKVQGRN